MHLIFGYGIREELEMNKKKKYNCYYRRNIISDCTDCYGDFVFFHTQGKTEKRAEYESAKGTNR